MFGSSPLTTNNVSYRLHYVIVILIILCFVYIVYVNVNKIDLEGFYDKSHGCNLDTNSQLLIDKYNKIKTPTYNDEYLLGSILLLNNNNKKKAYKHFNKALDKMITGKGSVQNKLFVLDKIENHTNTFIGLGDEIDIDVEIKKIDKVYKSLEKQIKKEKPIGKKSIDKKTTDKKISNKKEWKKDKQNVHDSIIRTEIQKQITSVTKNINMKDDYATIKKYMYSISNNEDTGKLATVFKVIDNNYNTYYVTDNRSIHEQEFIQIIWSRAHDIKNENTKDNIIQMLRENIMDCVEDNYVVCIEGRITRYWQSLDINDFENMGSVQSKQLVRNDFLDKCAALVDDIMQTYDEKIVEDYINEKDTADVNHFITYLKSNIENLASNYKDTISKHQLDILISECQETI